MYNVHNLMKCIYTYDIIPTINNVCWLFRYLVNEVLNVNLKINLFYHSDLNLADTKMSITSMINVNITVGVYIAVRILRSTR